ncbi:MAG: alpha/beta hydrolase [Gammaproteobacteria bacterium]|nr:MAG: alpha/beta hydrolase [Gammaproteobacteria bacterium]
MKAIHARKLLRPIQPTYQEMFSGRVYTVGKGAVSVRNHSAEAEHTVIGVHGFLENHCYFTQTYQAPDTELILLTCSNYHIPVSDAATQPAPWEREIKYAEATIEYDAAILNQAMENLPTTGRIRVHGHSRGGAVILDAIRQRPDLYQHADIVLEAPVLPGGRLHPMIKALLEPVSHGMWPWVVRLINSSPSNVYSQTFLGKMTPRKRALLEKPFTATRDHLTIVRNIENILEWMERHEPEALYAPVQHGTFLLPQVDRILDLRAMKASAERSHNAWRIVETRAQSHFITLDSLEWVPPLDQVPAAHVA